MSTATKEKPARAMPNVGMIPDKIRFLNRYVVWDWIKKDGKWTKPPIHPRTGLPTDATDETAWMSLHAAVAAADRLGAAGVGFALGKLGSLPFSLTVVDIDDCLDDDEPNELAEQIVSSLESYTEITPSLRGIRVWVEGRLPERLTTAGAWNKFSTLNIEFYDHDRYLTVTGNPLPSTMVERSPMYGILERSEKLASVHAEVRRRHEEMTASKPKAESKTRKPSANGKHAKNDHTDHGERSDEEILRVAGRSPVFSSLWDGALTGCGSQSEADLSLMTQLAFYCGPSHEDQVKRLFLQSAPGQRDKAGRTDYLDRTAARAYINKHEYFEWNPPSSNGHTGHSANGQAAANGDSQSADSADSADSGPSGPENRPDDASSSGYILRNKVPVSNATNTCVWLSKKKPGVVLRYDRFRQVILFGDEPLTDRIVNDLAMEIEKSLGVTWSQEHTRSALMGMAYRNEFSSLTEYLDSLKWDGIDRIAKFFPDHYESDDDEYSHECGRVFFLSAIARAYQPGCQADIMPVLIGPQGVGKSTGIAGLCPNPDWFADDIGDLFTGKAAESLQGKWIFEFGEFAKINRSTLDIVKSFITRRVDRYRPPYGRLAQDYPRSCVFFGTTNDECPLQDLENRRFLPIKVIQANWKAIASNRDQLWAEAVKRYKEGEKWWIDSSNPTSNFSKKLSSHLRDARAEDAWEPILADRLRGRNRVTTIEAAEILGLWSIGQYGTTNKLGRSEQTRIGIALRAIGFEVGRESTGDRERFYKRDPSNPVQP